MSKLKRKSFLSLLFVILLVLTLGLFLLSCGGEGEGEGDDGGNGGETPTCTDADNDGYVADTDCGGQYDCDDSNAAVNPGAQEGPAGSATCSDGLDNDCDGLIDEADEDCEQEEPEVTDYGIIMGTVTNMAGSYLGDVTVTAAGLSTSTNSQGWFSIDNVPETERLLVNFSKEGYVPTTEIVTVRIGESSYVATVISAWGATDEIPAESGGTLSSDDGSVTIEANSMVDATGAPYTGSAAVALTVFDPSTDAGLSAFPGEFEGVDDTGTTVDFDSFGFMDVTITGESGEELELASGATATITIPVPAGLLASAPASIPLWFFNTTDGKWHQEGTATLSGGVYTGTVSHFTVWNVDLPRETSYVTGRVIDAQGPVRGARVTIKGDNWSSGESSTPSDGTFRIPVAAGRACDLWASKGGTESDHVYFTSAPYGSEYDVGDIYLGVPPIQITLTWGLNPDDLDSHLTIPMSGGTREHVYYGNESAGDADLDTDDTTGYGPEVITVMVLHDGVYRYSVHHFSGSGTISSSDASVNMIIDRVGIYNLTPPAGASDVDDVWSLWDITVESGSVTGVSVVNTYLNEVSSWDVDSFSP